MIKSAISKLFYAIIGLSLIASPLSLADSKPNPPVPKDITKPVEKNEPKLGDDVTLRYKQFWIKPYGWLSLGGFYSTEEEEVPGSIKLTSVRFGAALGIGPVSAQITTEAFLKDGYALKDAYLNWTIIKGLNLKGGQFKTPFGLKYNTAEITDEFPTAPVSLTAANPGRQIGFELSYNIFGYVIPYVAVLSGTGENMVPDVSRVAWAGKLIIKPLAFSKRLPKLYLDVSYYYYDKTNMYSSDLKTPLGFRIVSGSPANGPSYKLTAGGAIDWRFLHLRGEYFRTKDSRTKDDDGDPSTPGVRITPMFGEGFYIQFAGIVTGQNKSMDSLIPILKGYRIQDSAVELTARYEWYQIKSSDTVGNGINTAAIGVNWYLFNHMKVFFAAYWMEMMHRIVDFPDRMSFGFICGLAGYSL